MQTDTEIRRVCKISISTKHLLRSASAILSLVVSGFSFILDIILQILENLMQMAAQRGEILVGSR